MGHYKTTASAAASWSVVRKKLLAGNAATAGSPSSNPNEGKSTAETSAGGVADADDDEGGCKFTPINTPKTPKKKRATKGERAFNLKMEADENEEVTPAAFGDAVTPKKAGKRSIKPEDNESEETKPAVSTPSKKRVRKPKDDGKPPPKRTKIAITNATATALRNQDNDSTTFPATFLTIKEEGNDDGDDVVLPTELEEELLQAESDGLLQVETPPEEAQNGQGK